MISEEQVAEVRAFNRFYTGVIGALDEGLLDSRFSLTEARVLFELAQRDSTEVTELRERLGLDAGYLSRLLTRFAADDLLVREKSATDARRQVIRLSPAGRSTFDDLDARSVAQIRDLLGGLAEPDRRRLLGAMSTVHDLLSAGPASTGYLLRPWGPGDLGWVVGHHGTRYAQEFGWNSEFEAIVARIVADYAEHHDPRRDNAWIAEVDGEPVGCVACVGADEQTAKLRLLLVEAKARGLGIGGRLVEECIRFARRVGYRRMTLWTVAGLDSARRIYEHAGFRLVESEPPARRFGTEVVSQTWSLDL